MNISIVKQSVDEVDISNVNKKIEYCARIAYRSNSQITDTSYKNLFQILLKGGHESVLEHAWISSCYTIEDPLTYSNLFNSYHDKNTGYIYANIRAWRDYFKNLFSDNECYSVPFVTIYNAYKSLALFKHYLPELFTDINVLNSNNTYSKIDKDIENDIKCDINNKVYKILDNTKILTYKFVTNRAIANELERHRVFSFTQESTRYVNFNKKPISVIAPLGISNSVYDEWLQSVSSSLESYKKCIDNGASPQQARDVLPLCLETTLVMTGTINQWSKMVKLRTQKDCHPQIIELLTPIKEKHNF